MTQPTPIRPSRSYLLSAASQGVARLAICSLLLTAPVAAAAAPPGAGEQADAGSIPTEKAYGIRAVDPRLAVTWVWDLCAQEPQGTCRVRQILDSDRNMIAVFATDRVQAKVARMLAERDNEIRHTRSFQLVVLQAAKSGGIDQGLSEGARAALRDVREYLPFQSFRLLDTAFITTSMRGEASFSGPNGFRYHAELSFGEEPSVDGPVLIIRGLEIKGEREVPIGPSPPAGEGKDSRSRALTTETLLATSLSMRPGETVVVGTSKLDGGDDALVVLLTAVAD